MAAEAGVNLPPEIIMYDIVSRLPAKSVGRFRCVSKHWQTLLSDPQFLKLHFTLNNHQTKLIVLQDSSFLTIDFRQDCNNNTSDSDPIAICETLSLMPPIPSGYMISGSCNGFLLLYDNQNMGLSIANPITHESRQLPTIPNMELSIANPISHESRQLPTIPKGIHRYLCEFGFGYCSNDDEYTVVIISDHTCNSPVYMLKRNLWKRVENSPIGIDSGCGVFVNGALHWSSSWDSDHSKMICAFDLGCERFGEVEKPQGLKTEDDFDVGILGGCLCLVVLHRNSTTDFWLMKEYGVRESWTKYVAYSSEDYSYLKPLFFWRGDESVVVEGEERLALFGLKQETSRFIPVKGEQCSKLFDYEMWTFVESLFSPNSSKADEGPNQVKV